MSRPNLPKNATAYITYNLLAVETFETARGSQVRRTYRAKHFNCYGKYFRGHLSYLWDQEPLATGVAVDVRTLGLLKAGCCPEELSTEMIEGFE